MAKATNIVGKKFTRLIVLSMYKHATGKTYCHCRCDCGANKDCAYCDITQNKIKSCGCLKKQTSAITAKNNATHGMRNTRIYGIWTGMKQRCFNESNMHFKSYGGKGVTVCQEWLNFEPFYEWSRINGYAEHLTIDRINNAQGYCPENCRWVTQAEQQRNRSNNVLTHDKVKQIRFLLATGMKGREIAKQLSINEASISRIKLNQRWKNIT